MFAEVISDRGKGHPVVYLPGIDGSGQLLLGTAARLEDRFRLLRLRYRLGRDRAQCTYPHLARSAIEAVALRGVDQMVLLAESFGGAVAIRAALDFPERVSALALVNSFPHFRSRIGLCLSRVGARCTPAWAAGLGRAVLARRILFGRGGEDDAVAEFRRTTGSGFSFSEAYRVRLRMIQQLDLRADLCRVEQPVAIFASSADRIVDSVRQAEAMARTLPDVEVEILTDRGHLALPIGEIDWPARIARLVERAQGKTKLSDQLPRSRSADQ